MFRTRDPKLPEDDLRIETCWSDFKCFSVKFYISALVGVICKAKLTFWRRNYFFYF